MQTLRHLFLTTLFCLGCCCPIGACAVIVGADKAPPEVWEKLSSGKQVELIVQFDDSDIRDQAEKLNQAKGIAFDDNDTLRFKILKFEAIKQSALSALPSGGVEILKQYEALPLIFLRFRSTAALKALLAQPSVVKVYEDRKQQLIQ